VIENEHILSEPKLPVILIVDDILTNIKIMESILNKEGYRIETAINGKQALNMVRMVFPDIVLLDIVMPEMDGYEVCRILKSSPDTEGIPIIFLTVKFETEDIVKGFKAGAADYLAKPFNVSELLERVRTHVELKKKIDYEMEVRKRVEDDIRKRETDLKIKTQNIEEVNTALRVLLKRIEEDKMELEEKILSNIRKIVIPHIKRLKNSGLNANQKVHINILEAILNDILSPFLDKITSKYSNFTDREIQVVNLIREGSTNEAIAELLNISKRTVDFHRLNIRKKFRMQDKRTNLKSYLLNLS
jgi:DNA-binding response OmpR family regulator/DNA-binding CsgD family transcriptional regulator